MNLLLKSVKIIDSRSPLNGKVKDVFIKDGIIKKIADKIPEKEIGKDVKVFDNKGSCVSIGWFDMKANFRDPGQEMKEDIYSGMAAAGAGGFTGVALMPSTHPTLQTKADVEYLLTKSKNNLTDIFSGGCIIGESRRKRNDGNV